MAVQENRRKFSSIRFEKRGPVAWVTLDRPEAMNALSGALVEELGQAIELAEASKGVHALAITGRGAVFCAGADLKPSPEEAHSPNDSLERFLRRLGQVFVALEASPLPSIAAVNGLALAGGFELVLCCDLVVAAKGARLGDAHANYGLLPGAGGSVRLPRKIGPTRAKYLLYTGAFVPAAELVGCGLVNRVVPDEGLEPAVQGIAEAIASKSPLSTRRVKQLVDDGSDQPLHSALRQEVGALLNHAHSHDMREGLAAFNEKREPRFEGR